MSRGVVILALGKPRYGQFAFNLARSLKVGSKLPVALVYGGNALGTLSKAQKRVFNQLIPCPKHVSHFNGTLTPCRAKLMLYDLSPFDETLFLDADSLVFPGKDVNDVLNTYTESDFVTFCYKGFDPIPSDQPVLWSSILSILETFPEIEHPIYQIHSFWMFWRKTQRNKEFFALAQDIYERLTTKTLKLNYGTWNGQVPDELPLAIATGIMGVCPLPVPGVAHRPIVDVCTEQSKDKDDILANYCSFTLPGCTLHSFWVNWYNSIANGLHNKQPIGTKFLWEEKHLRF